MMTWAACNCPGAGSWVSLSPQPCPWQPVRPGLVPEQPLLRVMGLDTSIAKLWTVSERETGIAFDFGEVREVA